LDGKGTFHGMGLISIRTGTGNFGQRVEENVIKRIRRMPVKESVKNLALSIKPYIAPDVRALSTEILKDKQNEV